MRSRDQYILIGLNWRNFLFFVDTPPCRRQTQFMAGIKDTRRGSTVYFEEEIIKRLKIYGIITDRSMSDLVNEAVLEYLDRNGVPETQKSKPTKSKD